MHCARMLRSLVSAAAVVLLLQAAGSDAFFRMECPGRLAIARMDPLVAPGEVSQHAHAIYGSNGFSMTSGFEELRAGECTSCRVKMDKSSYWHPQLYFRDDGTGMYEQVEPNGGMNPYYNFNGANLTAFPAGFRMIAGNNQRREWDLPWDPRDGVEPEKSLWSTQPFFNENGRRSLALGINCLKATDAEKTESTLLRHYMPTKEVIDTCTGGIRFELVFPSCWNGRDLDSPNHQDHVRYADLVLDGGCGDAAKEGFNIQLPTLLYEVFYDTGPYVGRNGEYVVANGDYSGLAYHGDFISGWDATELQSALEICTNGSGRLEDCQVFQTSLMSKEEAATCKLKMPDILVNENVVGPANDLPGNVRIFSADPKLGIPAVPGVVPGDGGDPTLDIGYGVVGNGIANGGTLNESDKPDDGPPAPATTEAPVIAAVNDLAVSPEVISTEYITSGNLVSEIHWVQEVVTATETVGHTITVTMTDERSPTAVKARRGLGHRHGHGHFAAHRHRH